MADLYKSKVEELATALQREDTRLEASEMLRGLVEAIVLTPQDGQLRIELRGIWPRCWLLPRKRKGCPKRATSSCRFNWLRGLATR